MPNASRCLQPREQVSRIVRSATWRKGTARPAIPPIPIDVPRIALPPPARHATIGTPGDRYEREADVAADRVLQGRAPPLSTAAPESIQRMCAECAREEEEKNRLLQRKESPGTSPTRRVDVEAAAAATKSQSQPLPPAARAFFEPRFSHDFRQVRVHVDSAAARAVHARAFTLGTDVVFRAGEYDPRSAAGNRLLAHELAHVVQQARGAPRAMQAKLEVEAPQGALPGAPPRKNWEEIRDYVRALSGVFDVNSSGAVTPTSPAACAAPVARTTERCLCDLHASPNRWKAAIDDIAWPHTEEANHRVTVHSTRSPVQFGAWGGGAQAGTRVLQDNPRVLAHELCGHAWLMERGVHPTGPAPVFVGGRLMGRPSHDPTVAVENVVAGEVSPGAPRRGLFADPHHGESFARVTVSGFPTNVSRPSTLPADMQARLVRVKDAMTSDALMRADVVGHADHTGTAAANAVVSLARARDVRDHLISLGVGPGQFLEVVGRSDSECSPGAADNPACRKAEVFMFMFQGASLRNP